MDWRILRYSIHISILSTHHYWEDGGRGGDVEFLGMSLSKILWEVIFITRSAEFLTMTKSGILPVRLVCIICFAIVSRQILITWHMNGAVTSQCLETAIRPWEALWSTSYTSCPLMLINHPKESRFGRSLVFAIIPFLSADILNFALSLQEFKRSRLCYKACLSWNKQNEELFGEETITFHGSFIIFIFVWWFFSRISQVAL